jgi:hypothetical protein
VQVKILVLNGKRADEGEISSSGIPFWAVFIVLLNIYGLPDIARL